MIRRAVAALLLMLALAGIGLPAAAHESRPASLEIDQAASGAVHVVWKRPMQGDMVLHLIPHLSSGWLERDPDDAYASGDYMISSWTIARPDRPLAGQTLAVEGLAGTITDALVRIRYSDGKGQAGVLRGAAPELKLGDESSVGTTGRFKFVKLGVEHILTGPDHLLFVLGLILIVGARHRLLVTVTGFTLGHTVTLITASLLRLDLPLPLIDLLIALSILFLGPEVLRAARGERSLTTDRPYIVAFCFGLLHGLGFASGMSGIGLRGVELVTALLQFNVGVELGQLAFVFVALGVIHLLKAAPVRWPQMALRAPAYLVGIAGATWMLARGATIFGF
jgi:hydrogenase/urease accessory protein HupE